MPEPSFDKWTSLFLLFAFQSMLSGGVLSGCAAGNRPANRSLALLLLSFALTLVDYELYWTHYNLVFTWYAGIGAACPFFSGPLIWLYGRHGGRRKSRRMDAPHLLPFAYCLVYMARFLTGEAKRQFILHGPQDWPAEKALDMASHGSRSSTWRPSSQPIAFLTWGIATYARLDPGLADALHRICDPFWSYFALSAHAVLQPSMGLQYLLRHGRVHSVHRGLRIRSTGRFRRACGPEVREDTTLFRATRTRAYTRGGNRAVRVFGAAHAIRTALPGQCHPPGDPRPSNWHNETCPFR